MIRLISLFRAWTFGVYILWSAMKSENLAGSLSIYLSIYLNCFNWKLKSPGKLIGTCLWENFRENLDIAQDLSLDSELKLLFYPYPLNHCLI